MLNSDAPNPEGAGTPHERATDAPPSKADKIAARKTVLSRIGKLAAEQAMPIAVGLVSLIIAVDAWLSARPMAWEKTRALASMQMVSTVVPMGHDGRSETVVTVTISNVGELTFAVLDLQLQLETTGALAADWKANTLLGAHGAALPIGLRPFRVTVTPDSASAMIEFDPKEKSWHVVDPGRSVSITFVQPTRGSGHLALLANVYTQPMKMADVAAGITENEQVNGITRPTMPESGTGEVSTLPIYPYTAGHIVVIPPP